MEIKKGIAVSPGVAICPAVVLDAEDVFVPRRTISAESRVHEHARVNQAIEGTSKDIEALRDEVAKEHGDELAKIFTFHLGMLQDKTLIEPIHATIDEESVTAEYAISTIFRSTADKFLKLPSEFFKDRVTDIYDLEKRLLKHLMTEVRSELEQLDHDAIVVAYDLTPSETAGLNRNFVKAMATDMGGRTSHTAIIARALEIPAVVGLKNASVSVNKGDTVIVDGNQGLIIINPNADQLQEYKGHLESYLKHEKYLENLADLPAVTKDDQEIELMANIELTEEIPPALERGAMGVGLYRSEFLFLSAGAAPDEAYQYESYSQAIKSLNGKPITIRTFDLGADKYSEVQVANPERNPFLGCRSIRYCLQNLTMFKTHLRAILRASVHGKVRLMFPLITNMMELRQAKMIMNDVMEDLEDEGIAFDPDIEVGMMIEVPSVAIQASAFADEVDFFSIGTNDLVQYTLAVDRGNQQVANLYSPAHPAVLRLIKEVMNSSKKQNVPVSICGEMAGEPVFVMLLLGLGLRYLSMTPHAIPEVKQIIRSVTIKDCIRVARRALKFDSDRQVMNYLRDEMEKIMPEQLNGSTI